MCKITTFKSVFAAISGVIISALGGFDYILSALLSLIIIDYLTGVVCAIKCKKLSSSIGFMGIFRKLMIFVFVYIAVIFDNTMKINVLRSVTIMFYIMNEGLSILENAGRLGVQYPNKLKDVLLALKEEDNKK